MKRLRLTQVTGNCPIDLFVDIFNAVSEQMDADEVRGFNVRPPGSV